MVTEDMQIDKNLSIQDEKLIQKELRKFNNSFCHKYIDSKQVIKGEYIDKNTFEYNGSRYELKSCKNNEYISKGTEIYIPVFVLDFHGLERKFSPGWFTKKINAQDKLNEYNSFTCMFKENTDLQIINSKSYITSQYLQNKFIRKILNIDSVLLWGYQSIIYLLIYMFTGFVYPVYFENSVFVLITSFLIIGISFIPGKIINTIKQRVTDNSSIMVELKNINLDDISTSKEYKVVSADVRITKNKLILYSEELDCEWVFEKNDNYMLSSKGIKLLNIIDSTNTVVFSVRKTWSEDSLIKSEDGTWWIESLEN